MKKLQPEQSFPSIEAPFVGGESLTVPDELNGDPNVVLFYRGHW